jgi:predicted permease
MNAAVFSVAEAALLRSWPAKDPARLVRITATTPQRQDSSFSYPDYRDLGSATNALEGVLAYSRHAKTLRIGSESQWVLDDLVSANYFDVLGIRAVRGRTFSVGRVADEPVVVISDALWRRAFNADPALVGQTIILTGRSYTVLGIAPTGFRGLERAVPTDAWIPVETEYDKTALGNRTQRGFELLGRLRNGATPAQARAELESIGRGLAEAYLTVNSARRLTLVSEDERMRGVLFPALLLMTAVGLVLLISCANVAGLLLARSDSRRREIAVRLALGVSRRRLVRQLLTESGLLGSVGAAFGLVVAWWLLQLQPALMPPTPFEVGFDLRLDRSVVVFTCIASAFAVLAFGLVPALQATNVSVVPALKNAERSGSRSMRGLWVRNIFVLGEIALSAVLVTASTLLVRSLLQSQAINLGTDGRKHLVFFDLNPAVAGYDGQRSMDLFDRVAENVRAVPGVVRASFARRVLLSGSGGGAEQRVSIPGVSLPQAQPNIRIKFNAVAPGYFEAVGTRLLRGRSFTPADNASSARVVLVSETMARRLWDAQDPIGRHLIAEGRDCEIVGIVEDAKINNVHEATEPFMYFPFSQLPSVEGTIIAETNGDQDRVVATVRDRIRTIDANLPVTVATRHELMRLAFWQDSIAAWVVGALGSLGIFLAAVGLYGIISHRVSQRRHELGIRMALGAAAPECHADGARSGVEARGLGDSDRTGRFIWRRAPHVQPLVRRQTDRSAGVRGERDDRFARGIRSKLRSGTPGAKTRSTRGAPQRMSWRGSSYRDTCGSNAIRSRVRVACAKRSSASVDGRTFPPSIRAMYDCDVFIRRASCDCDRPAAVRASISVRARSNSSPRAS